MLLLDYMPVLGGSKGLIDLPGYDRIALVAHEHEELIKLRGSGARRLALHLIENRDVDHTLPAVCSPPPSDLDLAFATKESARIEAVIGEIRNSALLFQAIRIEASSISRIQDLESAVEFYIDCPVFGISVAGEDEEGFVDPSGRGLQQLVERRLTFRLNGDTLSDPDSLEPDVRFHLYCAGLVFAKAAYEHGTRDDFLDSEAMAFCRQNAEFIRAIATPDGDNLTEHTPYYRARLYGIAYSLRAMIPRKDFEEHVQGLLPPRMGRLVAGTRPFAPLFNISKSLLYEPPNDWLEPRRSDIGDFVDLSYADPVASSPSIPLRPGALSPDGFVEGIVPLAGNLGDLRIGSNDSLSAAIRLNVKTDDSSESIWLQAFCEAAIREETLALRVSVDQVARILEDVNELFGPYSASINIHLLGHHTEQRRTDTILLEPITPDEDEFGELLTPVHLPQIYYEATEW